ncbi:15220_t:CDS:2 [Funneliformis caledonium]|uniref:15220_t:CDS:1 n=1 Tax=Funneliformis caledonium TaxID=1117310 RepID=A0A9N8V8D7_9GLOM|nr:15220_t:CDS:2 [Funneliformis caledonium]
MVRLAVKNFINLWFKGYLISKIDSIDLGVNKIETGDEDYKNKSF